MSYDLIIIGAGPAGMTAGIYAVRQKLNTLLITKSFGGQLARKAVAIENYPGFEEISGLDLIKKFEKHLRKFTLLNSRKANLTGQVDIERDGVRKVKKIGKKFLVQTTGKNTFEAKAVIIASGADPRPLEVPGEKKFIGKGVSYCTTCLPPGEEVVTNSSLEAIDKIGISHRVLTSDRKFHNINQIMGRDYNGKIIKIKTRFFTEPVTLTFNHAVLTSEIQKILNWKIKINKTRWKKAGELSVNDAVLYPIVSKVKDVRKIKFSEILGVETKNGKAKNDQETHTSHRLSDQIPVDKKFLRLAGYYLSEGSLGKQHIIFYFNKNERKYINDTKNLLKELFHLKPFLRIQGGVIGVGVSSKLLRDLFQTLFGKNAPNKKIPHWVLFLPKEKQGELIKGIFRGDGCTREKDFSLTTSSKIMTYQLRDILLRFKIIPGIDKDKKERLNKTPGEIGGRKIRFNYDRYQIRVGGPSLEKMSEILGIHHPKIDKRRGICRHAWIKGNYLYLPVREIKAENYKGRVYNLIVEENGTFVAKNFIVHNCDGPLFVNKEVAVVGGGNSGFEAALFLANWVKKIYILEYAAKIRADEIVQEKVKKIGKIEIITSAILKKVQGKEFVNSLVYQDQKSKKIISLKVDGIFVEIGSQPATSFVKGLVDFNEKDEIIVNPKTMQTKTTGLFAAGDVSDVVYKQIVIAAGQGAKAALSVSNFLLDEK